MLQRMRVVLGFALMVMGALGTLAGPVQSKQRRETRSNRPLAPRSASARYRPGGELAAGLGIGVSEQAGPTRGGDASGEPRVLEDGGLRAAVESLTQQLVAEQLGVDIEQLAPEVSLTDDLAADSLDLLELALVLESEFTIALPQRRVGQIRTYRDLVDAVMASSNGRQRRERLTSRPLSVKSRVVSAWDQSASLERGGELTPYAMEVIAEDAARAGRGARLEVTMPASVDDLDLAVVREELAHLGRRGVEVRVRRDVGAGEES